MYPCEIVKNEALPGIFDKIELDIRIILSNNFIAGVCYYRSIIYCRREISLDSVFTYTLFDLKSRFS